MNDNDLTDLLKDIKPVQIDWNNVKPAKAPRTTYNDLPEHQKAYQREYQRQYRVNQTRKRRIAKLYALIDMFPTEAHDYINKLMS